MACPELRGGSQACRLWEADQIVNRPHNVLIVSDLHLSQGWNPATARTSRLEDFLRDDAFDRFLRHHEAVKSQPRFGDRPWLLILNGDIFDFLQVVSLPREGRELREVKGVRHRNQLSPHERQYGLGTTAVETEWKLKQIAKGHQRFFAALGWFVAQGNHIAIIRGNHDVELHWPEVQDRFTVEERRAYTRRWLRVGGIPPVGPDTCRERIHFHPWFYHEPGRIYVEHGCQYDAANHFRDILDPVLPDDARRIDLPWGSLFVRYLFNKVEDLHPFADNVKPLTRYMRWAFRTNPAKAIEVLVRRGWAFMKAFWMMGRKATEAALHRGDEGEEPARKQLPLPPQVAERIRALADDWVSAAWQVWLGSFLRALVSVMTALVIAAFVGLTGVSLFLDRVPGWQAGAYAASALVALLLRRGLLTSFSRLLERDDLLSAAFELERILAPPHAVPVIVMGHNHDPTIQRLKDAWYVNTGAWVPLYQREGPIEGREVLTFCRIAWDHEGPPELLRWDDAGGAPTRLVVWDDARSR